MSGGGTGDGNDGDTPVAGPPVEPPKGDRDPRRAVAQTGYELGLPLRTVGAQAGVTEAAVRLWAKEEGWTRPERAKRSRVGQQAADTIAAATPAKVTPIRPGVRVEGGATSQTTQSAPCEAGDDAKCEANAKSEHDTPLDELFRERVRQLLECPTRDEAADVAARAVVQVVMTHRAKANRLAGIVDKLANQLELAADSRDLLEALIYEETEPGKKRAAMLRLVSLPSHAGTIRDLSTAFQKLVLMERQAFGLGLADDPTPPPPPSEVTPAQKSDFDRIRERVRLRLAQSPGASA